jgi:phage head maturation protease
MKVFLFDRKPGVVATVHESDIVRVVIDEKGQYPSYFELCLTERGDGITVKKINKGDVDGISVHPIRFSVIEVR